MAYYLYVPFKKKEVPANLQNSIEQWIQIESQQKNDVIPCYSGENSLTKLPENAKIIVLLHGKPGKASPLTKGIHSETTRFFPGLAKHLQVTDGNSTLQVPEIADKMIEDGLLHDVTDHLQIQLFFLDANIQEARSLAVAFFNSLNVPQKNSSGTNGTIRLDYFANQSVKGSSASKELKLQQFIKDAKEPKNSIYNKNDSYPKLSLDQISEAIKEYNRYKSSRCCGLSGLLGLNGLFSSNASAHAIKNLSNKEISESNRLANASLFIERFPQNYFAQCLQPVVKKSIEEHELFWTSEMNQLGLQLLDLY